MSIFIVAVLNVILAPGFAFAYWLLRKLRQRCLTRCVQTASQENYDGAWIGDEFLLDYRWAWWVQTSMSITYTRDSRLQVGTGQLC